MTAKSNSSLVSFKFFSQLCSLIAAALGVVAIVGWLMGWRILTSIRADYIPMAPNTALSFIILGISLCTLITERKCALKLSRFGATVIFVLSLIRFTEFTVNINLNVDRWIFQVPGEKLGLVPVGQMALPTTLNFLFASVALFLASSLKKHLFVDALTRVLGGLTTFIGLAFSLGYIYGAPLLYGAATIPMALNTAIAFFVLGLGFVINNVSHDIAGRKQATETLRKAHDELEVRVAERTAELTKANEALRAEITERKRAAEALQESEKRYRQVVENAVEIIYTTDAKGNFTYANDAALKTVGYSLEELRRFNYLDLVVPEHRDRLSKIYINQFREKQATTYVEFPFLKKSGEVMWFGQNASLVIEGGKVTGFHIIARDITERKRAEEALRWSEETARALLNATTDSVFLIDSGGTVLALNEMAAKRLSTRVDAMLGACLYDFLPPDLAERRKTRFDEVFRTGKPAYFEDERQGIWFDNCVYPISDVSGKVMKLAIYGRDITDRKRAEEALKESEEKYRTILENIEEGYYEVDIAGNFTFLNDSMCRIIGYPKDELMGMNNRQYTDKENAKRLFQAFNEIYRTGKSHIGYDYEIIRKDGAKKYVETSILLQKDSSGNPLGFRGIIRDITDRKKAEEARRESEERFRELYDNAPVGYHEYDSEGRITRVNRTDLEMLGYTAEEMIGQYIWKFNLEEETVRQQVLEKLSGLRPPGRGFERIYKRKDGTTLMVLIEDGLIRDENGKIMGIRVTIQDITERKKAEEALREGEEKYRRLVEGLREHYFFYAHDTKGVFVYISPSVTNILGYSQEEFLINFTEYLTDTPINDAAIHHTERSIKGEQQPPYELEIFHRDGGIRWLEVSEMPIFNAEGKVIAVEGIAHDITERKRAEEALKDSEERFRALFEQAAVGVAQIETETGRFLRINQKYCDIVGYTIQEMQNLSFQEITHPEDLQADLDNVKLLIESKIGESSAEKRYYHKGGSIVWVNLTVSPMRTIGGKVVSHIAVVQDITERKRGEESLRQSEENARQLAQENAIMAEIGRIISSTLDFDEVYEGFSAEVKKIIPFDRVVINFIDTEKDTVKNVYMAGKVLQDRNVKDVYPLEGSGNAEMVRTRSTLLIQTEDFSEYKDRFPMLLSTFQAGFRSVMNVPLFSKGKVIGGLLLRSHKPYAYTDNDVRLAERIASQIAGAVANAQLYAERIQSEQVREVLQEQLRQSQKMEAIGRLAGGVAHDFNNILTVIKGYSQLSLAEMKEEDPFRENIEEIKKSADRAADLTRQLLAFSRRQIMEMKVLDLNDSLKNLDKMLRRLISEDIELVTLLAEDLGRVNADPGQIEQMIVNLVVNARDAMLNGGKLTIETANVELDQAYARAHIAVKPGRYVMVSVSDTGVGMAPEVRDRVFEPFFTTKEKGKGTGLGLSTVYGIVKQSGGNIWVYSEPGRGTSFKIYLPLVDEPLEELKEKVLKEELPGGSETIFIVEDEREVLKLAGRILEKQGYHVVEAASGEEALKVCKEKKEPFHLLLTDVVMPQMSGRQLAEELKQICQDFKILYMSGYTDNAITHHGVLEKGMNYLQKPFTVDSLARKVREVLDK